MVRIQQSIVGAAKGYQGHRIKMPFSKFSRDYFGSNYTGMALPLKNLGSKENIQARTSLSSCSMRT